MPAFIYNLVVRETLPLKQPTVPYTPTIVPSAGNAVLTNGALQSYNFETGVDGWRFEADGDIEGNKGNFRGDITGASGTFSGTLTGGSLNIPDTTTANSFHVNTAGDTWWGSATIGGALAKIEKTGKGTFTDIVATGTINAEAGYLATGVYINTTDTIICESAGLNVGVAGHIRGGQTNFATGNGFFLGYSGDYKFSVGTSANYLRWDGTYLKLLGSFDVGTGGVINNSTYLVANLPIAPTTVGFNNPSGID